MPDNAPGLGASIPRPLPVAEPIAAKLADAAVEDDEDVEDDDDEEADESDDDED